MIDELHVKNLALIKEALLSPSPGMTVITGETGAGKTALLGALKLLAGERADASLVREGESSLTVQGRFFLGESFGFEGDDVRAEGIVASRSIAADGRSRAHLNGSISQVGKIASTVGASIDICGQHEHQRLLKPANHRGMLDAWIGADLTGAIESYRRALRKAREAAEAVREIEQAQNLSEEQVGQARYVLSRIDDVSPVPGEYEDLCRDIPRFENGEALMSGVDGARNALSGDGGALESLGGAMCLIERAAALDPSLEGIAESLREASYILEDAALDVRRYVDDLDFDPCALAEMQERLSQIQGLIRSWGPGMEQVFEARDAAARTLAAVDGFDSQMAEAKRELELAEEELRREAERLHSLRSDAAPGFCELVTSQMSRLMLGSASLECTVEMLERDAWATDGPSKVEFMFRPGEGMSARPLAKIASGGEVSRVMLAIKVVLGQDDPAETLVFDEVDSGVGGAAALSLAEVLSDLARTHQVILVTHLAQLAVMGQVHYLASKQGSSQPETVFTLVEGEDRVREIARMLSGGESLAAIDHARHLLEGAALRDQSRLP